MRSENESVQGLCEVRMHVQVEAGYASQTAGGHVEFRTVNGQENLAAFSDVVGWVKVDALTEMTEPAQGWAGTA